MSWLEIPNLLKCQYVHNCPQEALISFSLPFPFDVLVPCRSDQMSFKGYKCVKSLFEGGCGEVAVNQYLAHIQLLSDIQRLKRI